MFALYVYKTKLACMALHKQTSDYFGKPVYHNLIILIAIRLAKVQIPVYWI